MAGTKQGGLKTVAKILARDPDHFRKIGALGGAAGNTGGFKANPQLASIAGAKGGRISRRKWTAAERMQHSEQVIAAAIRKKYDNAV